MIQNLFIIYYPSRLFVSIYLKLCFSIKSNKKKSQKSLESCLSFFTFQHECEKNKIKNSLCKKINKKFLYFFECWSLTPLCIAKAAALAQDEKTNSTKKYFFHNFFIIQRENKRRMLNEYTIWMNERMDEWREKAERGNSLRMLEFFLHP